MAFWSFHLRFSCGDEGHLPPHVALLSSPVLPPLSAGVSIIQVSAQGLEPGTYIEKNPGGEKRWEPLGYCHVKGARSGNMRLLGFGPRSMILRPGGSYPVMTGSHIDFLPSDMCTYLVGIGFAFFPHQSSIYLSSLPHVPAEQPWLHWQFESPVAPARRRGSYEDRVAGAVDRRETS